MIFICFVFVFDFFLLFFFRVRALYIISFHLILTFVSPFDMVCDYVDTNEQITGEIKNCYTKDLNITSTGQSVDRVNGTTTMLDVQGFWVEDQTCNYVPQNIVAFMPNLKVFRVKRSALKTISKSDLAPFPELIQVDLQGNELQYIDGDLFSLNTKIQWILLEDSSLKIISGPILKPLTHLNYVKFGLDCLAKTCEHSSCIQETTEKFKKMCEFDSLYPVGFMSYFESLRRASENCEMYLKKPE